MAMNPTHVSAKAEGRNPFTRMCYICGREFGSKSIQIHEKNCIEKWDKQNAALPRDQRRTRPKPPQLVGNDGTPVGGKMTAGEYNEAAFQTFMNEGREECPNCGRGFLRDRLEIHLRSCKPGGHFAKEREKRMAAAAAASGKDPEPSTLSATPTKSRAVESLGGGKVQVMASRSLKPKTRPTTAARPASPIQPNSAAKASEMTAPRATLATAAALPVVVRPITAAGPGTLAKFCGDCGHQFGTEEKFCSSCGLKRAVIA